jgi:hypothetical protein
VVIYNHFAKVIAVQEENFCILAALGRTLSMRHPTVRQKPRYLILQHHSHFSGLPVLREKQPQTPL